MKKLLIGAVAGATITLLLQKWEREGKLDKWSENIEDFLNRNLQRGEDYLSRTTRKARTAKQDLDTKVDELRQTVLGEKKG
jgi:hypothetical protein